MKSVKASIAFHVRHLVQRATIHIFYSVSVAPVDFNFQ